MWCKERDKLDAQLLFWASVICNHSADNAYAAGMGSAQEFVSIFDVELIGKFYLHMNPLAFQQKILPKV